MPAASITNKTLARHSTGASFVSPIITPQANALYLALVVSLTTGGGTPNGISGCGLNWVQVDSVAPTVGSLFLKCALYRAMKPSGLSSGALTFSLSSSIAAGDAFAIVDEVTGVVTSGSDGANAIRQHVPGGYNGGGTDHLAIALAAFANTALGPAYGVFGEYSSIPNFSVDVGYTKLGEEKSHIPSGYSQWKQGEDLSVLGKWSASALLAGGFALELALPPVTVAVGQASPTAASAFDVIPKVHGRLPILQQLEHDEAHSVKAFLSGSPARKITRTLTVAQEAGHTLTVTENEPSTLEVIPFTDPC